MARQLLELRQVPLSAIPNLTLPNPRIKRDSDVLAWQTTRSYRDYAVFLRRLSEAVVGCDLPLDPTATANESIARTLKLLHTLEEWIQEIPPLPTPQRFGNLAFRTWGKRLEEQADELLTAMLPPAFGVAIPYLKPYLLLSFGSFTRMDYGTGHETVFVLFLLCLTLLRFYEPVPEEERQIVLRIYTQYLRLCWKLQDVYRLEPAGSHGVWGLDDYTILSYLFGSAQLRDRSDILVSSVLDPDLPSTNLYFMSISRIHQMKTGPFHEHSSQLHSIALGVPKWSKVHTGLFKMYEAEVLGKRVVVQHIPLGGLLEWEDTSKPDKHSDSTPSNN